MKVLITGGTGYLAGRLAVWLAADGHRLRIGSRRLPSPSNQGRDGESTALDWQDEESLRQACSDIDAIVHAAGIGAAQCQADPVAALDFHGVATARLLRAAVRAGVQRFICVSTAHVYGAALRGVVQESTCAQPLHPYATSHRAGEDVVLTAGASGSIHASVFRLSNSFGPPANALAPADCWKLVANDLCRQGVVDGRMVLQTAGRQRRDFIAMSEVCRVVGHFLGQPAHAATAGLFNVGGDWSPTLLELAQFAGARIEHALGYRPELVVGTATDSVGGTEFRFAIERLLATGFAPDPAAARAEMDRLVARCAASGTLTGACG